MHKNNITYNINNEKESENFAVVPHEQLVLVAKTVKHINSQMNTLQEMLKTFGIEEYSYNKQIKTLADIPHFKVDINGEKV